MNADRIALLLWGAVSLSMTGCAFVAGSTKQPVAVSVIHNNENLPGVGCTLRNDAGMWTAEEDGTSYAGLAASYAAGVVR